MSLTPEEVEQKEFTVTLRGFDQGEVISFLQTVAVDYRRALEGGDTGSQLGKGSGNSRPLGRLVPGVDASSDEFQAVGDQVAEVLRAAAEAAAAIRLQARVEADELFAAADARREQAKEEIDAELIRIEGEIDERRRRAEDEATAIIEAATNEARTLMDRAQAHYDELARGEQELASRLRTAASAIDSVLAEVGQPMDSFVTS